MADKLRNSHSYHLLSGINQKASKYEMSTAHFLDIRNLDFDVPNALQKRPGSTFAIGADNGTTGPIKTIFEFSKLTGESYIITASDTALFYLASGGMTLLDPGWNNGQPVDMLTFVNYAWMANGQKWKKFDGASATPVGLPISPKTQGNTVTGFTFYVTNDLTFELNNRSGTTFMLVGGATHVMKGVSWMARGVYLAYSYVRSDGYYSPVDFFGTARNLIQTRVNESQEYFGANFGAGEGGTYANFVGGITIPAGQGISAIALWVAVDTVGIGSSVENIPGVGIARAGNMGYVTDSTTGVFHYLSYTLKPTADTSRFWLYTLVPGASLFLIEHNNFGVGTSFPPVYGTTFIFGNFSSFDSVPTPTLGWSGMTSDFFSSYTPKYIEMNQNTMFIAGFSSQPSAIKFSEVGGPEVYFPENSIEVRTNDGDRVTGQKAFNNQMLFTKEHSFAKLIGDNANNYQLVEISTEFGCLSNNSMVIKDQTIYWLDRKGILEYNGAGWKIVSDAVEGIFRRMNLAAAKENAVGIHHLYRNQLWWGIPVDGSTQNNMTVVYDYLVGGWTFFDGFNPSSFGYVKGALSKPTVWRGDYSGMLHFTGESFFSDSGRAITCLALSAFEGAGGENQTTLWRRFFLDVATASGLTGQIKGQVFSNYDTSTVQATFSTYQDQFQTRVEMGVQGKAIAAQISHCSASLPLLVNGFGWAERPLRNV